MTRRGFTLIELLSAMLITIIIMGALTSALFIGFRARAAADRAVNVTRTVDLALETLSQDFRQVVPPKTGVLQPLSGTFYGDESTVTLYRTQMAMSNDQRGGVIQIDYLIDNGNLIRRVYSNVNPLAQAAESGTDEVVVSGVTSFTLSYYDSSATTWQSTWDSTSNTTSPLPTSVEMVLEFKEDGKVQATKITHIFAIPSAVPVYNE